MNNDDLNPVKSLWIRDNDDMEEKPFEDISTLKDLLFRLYEEKARLDSYVIEGQYNDPDANLTEYRSVYTSLEKAKEAYNLLKQYNYETLNLYKAGEDAYGEVVGVGEPIISLGSTK